MLLVVLKRVDDRTTELEKTLNLIKEQSKKMIEVLTSLEELDDVQNIFTNAKLKN